MANLDCFRTVLAGVLVASLAVGCDDDDGGQSIVIVDPVDGTTLTAASDTDPSVDGIQYTVRAQATGFAPGAGIDLEGVSVSGTTPPTVMADGSVEWNATFEVGTTTLEAVSAGDADVRSDPVTVTVSDACGSLSFVSPAAPAMGALRLGPMDDEDDTMCGDSFVISVAVATDASDEFEARIFVNDIPGAAVSVNGNMARFPNVALDRGDAGNQISVALVSPSGAECDPVNFPTTVFVDCEGASCSIVEPAMGPFLNADDDVEPMTDGFQGLFRVETDEGESVRLVVDGDETGAATATPGGDNIASFSPVNLDAGVHRVFAICTDATGIETRSPAGEWTVDITPCAIEFTQPDPDQLFVDSDDLDGSLPGIQIVSRGTTTGGDCSEVRVDLCPGVAGAMGSSTVANWMSTVTLSTMASQEICAQVDDLAGNTAEARRTIRLQTDAPMVMIEALPTTDFRVSNDLDTSSTTCEAAVSVLCDAMGSDVRLNRQDTGTLLDSAPCVAEGGLPMGFTGRASFPMLSLPSVDPPVAFPLRAEQDLRRLTGTSAPVSVTSDCDPPVIAASPAARLCGEVLRPMMDDVDTGTPGFQYDVTVLNTNTPKYPVVLDLVDVATMTSILPMPLTSSTPSAPSPVTTFPAVNFGSGGELEVVATSTDAGGNVGSFTCRLIVADLPTLVIASPTSGQVFNDLSADCDSGTAGLQVQVTATTDAPAGSSATVQIGTAMASTTVVAGSPDNTITACVDAAEGMQTVTVDVTLPSPPGGMTSVSTNIIVDTLPPTGAITDFRSTGTVDLRGGTVGFAWTAVEDTSGLLASYELRCSTDGPITDETEWMAASTVTVMTAPAASGTMHAETFGDFRLLEERWCLMRGVDLGGRLTPFPTTPPASVQLIPSESVLTGPAANMGVVVAAIGSVNGDTFDDIVVGSGSNPTGGDAAYVFFGSSMGPSTTPDVTILSPSGAASEAYALRASGIGDVNGDGEHDFAVSAFTRGGAAGTVYIFFGRTTPWPATIDLNGGGCRADVCLNHSTPGALFGWSVEAIGDFDFDGFDDIAIGAWLTNRVYVLLGGPMSTLATGGDIEVPGAMPALGPDGFIIEAPATSERFGTSITTCGDLTADNRDELLIGASGNPGTMVDGSVLRVDGRTYPGPGMVTIPGTMVTTLNTGAPGTYGEVIRCIGDFDGDSRRDLAAWNGGAGGSGGNIQVLYQRSNTYSGADQILIGPNIAPAANDQFGYSLGQGWHPTLLLLGDLDGDGRGDLAAGSRETGAGLGQLDLFYGRMGVPALLRRSDAASYSPTSAESTSSRYVAYIGDVNGDLTPDYAIGDPDFGAGAGRVLVYY